MPRIGGRPIPGGPRSGLGGVAAIAGGWPSKAARWRARQGGRHVRKTNARSPGRMDSEAEFSP